MIDLEIFGQIKALKNPHGENQLEREREIIISSGKKPVFYSQNTTISTNANHPAGCLVFCAKAASISKQISSQKLCRITATNSPRFLCLRALTAALENSAKNSQRPYCTDCIKSAVRPQKPCCLSQEICQGSSSKYVPVFSSS